MNFRLIRCLCVMVLLVCTAVCLCSSSGADTVIVSPVSTPLAEGMPASAAPVSDFTMNTTSGNAPLAVSFTDTSTGSPDGWEWDFGDGGISFDQHPVHTYVSVGSYDVSLTASKGDVSDTVTESGCIVVCAESHPESGSTEDALLEANFTVNATSGASPLTVCFTDTSTGSPDVWEWDFGDGVSSFDQHPVHTYVSAGSYDVNLTASKGDVSDTVTESGCIAVCAESQPESGSSEDALLEANFSVNATSGASPLTVCFTDTSTGSPDVWEWDFGDDEFSGVQHPVHTYVSVGSYDVSLTASNGDKSDTVTESGCILVEAESQPESGSSEDALLEANFTVNATSGASPLTVCFTDISTGSPDGWAWNFGDGVSSFDQHPVHTYVSAGNYDVSLTASKGDKSDTVTESGCIIVGLGAEPSAPPEAAFMANVTGGTAPLPVQFTDCSANAPVSWKWDFGDGVSSEIENPVHVYEDPGTYAVSLTVANMGGDSIREESEYIVVGNAPPSGKEGKRQLPKSSGLRLAGDGGWAYRINLTIDHNEISEDLTDFPVLVYLSGSSGKTGIDLSCVFNELGSDANRTRIAVTTSDGTTQCPVEIEKWDQSGKEAWLWVKVPSISASEDTTLWLFYDSDHAANTAYVGDTGSTPAQSVWSSNYSTVYHMAANSGEVIDSTGSGHNGSITGAAGVTSGRIGNALDFDGSDDYVQNSGDLVGAGTVTVSAWINIGSFGEGGLFEKYGMILDNSEFKFMTYDYDGWFGSSDTLSAVSSGSSNKYAADNSISTGQWRHTVLLRKSNGRVTFYIDGAVSGGTDQNSGLPTGGSPTYFGSNADTSHSFDGMMDEVTISGTERSSAWIAGTFCSESDDLITYGIPPSAAFSADPVSGDLPLSVSFSDLSTGNISSWKWSFGDGDWHNTTNSAERNVTHDYDEAGEYTVSLSVENGFGSSTETKAEHITAGYAPVANFSANRTSGLSPLAVAFTDCSTGGDPVSWNWSFGDGNYSDEQNPVHTYLWGGNYSVSLNVTNGLGSNVMQNDDYIVVYGPPDADFTGTPLIGASPLTVSFSDLSTGNITFRNWSFGDGTYGMSENPVHTYNSVGNYTVSLTAGNSYGNNTKEKSDYVRVCGGPSVDFSASPRSGVSPLTVDFNDLSTGNPHSWNWSFGDGNYSDEQNPAHIYENPGAYTVSLTATNDFGSSMKTENEYVVASGIGWLDDYGQRITLTIDHNLIQDDLCYFPVLVHLSASSGTNEADVTKVFTNLSVYGNRKKTAVTEFDGETQCPVEIEKWEHGTEAWLWVNVSYVSSEEDTILYLYYDSNHADNDEYVGDTGSAAAKDVWGSAYSGVYHMQDDSGSVQDSTRYMHDGTNSGADNVGGIIGDALEFNDGDDDYVCVSPDIVGTGDFTISAWIDLDTFGQLRGNWLDGYRAGRIVDNGHLKIHPYEKFKWSLLSGWFRLKEMRTTSNNGLELKSGDGTIDTGQYYHVAVTRNTENCMGTMFVNGNVVGDDDQYTDLPEPGNETFIGNQEALDRDFDGIIDELRVDHVLRSPAWIYALYYSERDNLINYGDGDPRPPMPYAYFDGTPETGEAPLSVSFTDHSTGDPDSWWWDFGDGNISRSENPAHNYVNQGRYNVSLTVGRAGRFNSTTKTDYITVYDRPYTNFTANQTTGDAAPLAVQFTDTTYSLLNITSWNWSFGDGSFSSQQHPLHIYNLIGVYGVSLNATNALGSTIETKTDYIYIGIPKADFSASPVHGVVPLNVTFLDRSANTPDEWHWDFGDGTVSSSRNVSHIYSDSGIYTISLTVSNSNGNSTLIKEELITVGRAPVASFTASETSGPAPLTVSFTDTSANSPDTWEWDFGDGVTSMEQHPVHTYENTGRYTVTLTAENEFGSDAKFCVDYIRVVDANWLPGGWNNRIKLTIDSAGTKIRGNLHDFPLLVHLSESSGITDENVTCVFDELQSDLNRRRIAVTESDGTSRLYAEIERFDFSSEEAWLWVKVPSISRDADTVLWLYFDRSAAENTGYVGDPGSTPAEQVWDSSFRAVYHMGDDPTGTVSDSTENGYDTTSGGGMTSGDLVGARIGMGIDFDGSNDLLTNSNDLIGVDNLTVSAWIYMNTLLNGGRIIDNGVFRWYVSNRNRMDMTSDGSEKVYSRSDSIGTNGWYFVSASRDENGRATMFVNGGPSGANNEPSGTPASGGATYFGNRDGNAYQGIIDELRICDARRTVAWIRARYYSESDDLITFGSSELPGVELELNVTGNITDWALSVNDPLDNENSGAILMNVRSNACWTVKVKDGMDGGKPAGTEGRMVECTAGSWGGGALTHAMRVKSGYNDYVTLTGSETEIESGTTTFTSGNDYDVAVRQQVSYGDPVLSEGEYRMVLIFTASVT